MVYHNPEKKAGASIRKVTLNGQEVSLPIPREKIEEMEEGGVIEAELM